MAVYLYLNPNPNPKCISMQNVFTLTSLDNTVHYSGTQNQKSSVAWWTLYILNKCHIGEVAEVV